jgi:nucleoside-diphosphate-sugar epimerase
VAPRRKIDGVDFTAGSVGDLDALRRACEGVDVVYATFATIRFFENLSFMYPMSHEVNVVGTENLIQACRAAEHSIA